MFKRNVFAVAVVCLCYCGACSREEGGRAPKLAVVDGTVTYKGRPLVGATVTFIPESGPLALSITDFDGKFKLATGTLAGAAVGPAKVTVSAAAPGQSGGSGGVDLSKTPTNPADSEAYFKKAAEMQMAQGQGGAESTQPKSLIPEKYSRPETSGLTFTVKSDGSNHYPIELAD